MLRALVHLLVPPRCAVCARPTEPARTLCEPCERALLSAGPLRFPLDGLEVTSAAPYEGVARRLVARLKFSGRTALAAPAAAVMAAAWPEAHRPGAALVPVPGVGLRVRARGFDPAALLAAELARRTGAELVPCLRRADRSRQVGRSRSQRLHEGPRVHARAGAARELAGRPVWLVDDVVTTGATLTACVRALRAAGIRCAGALTLARSLGLGGARAAA